MYNLNTIILSFDDNSNYYIINSIEKVYINPSQITTIKKSNIVIKDNVEIYKLSLSDGSSYFIELLTFLDLGGII